MKSPARDLLQRRGMIETRKPFSTSSRATPFWSLTEAGKAFLKEIRS
jgi:hypothetical protein